MEHGRPLRSLCTMSPVAAASKHLLRIHRSAWKVNAPMLDCRFTEFCEVCLIRILRSSTWPRPATWSIRGGVGRSLRSANISLFVERTSTIAHIYPSVLQAVSGRGYAGCLEGCFQGHRGEAMHYLGYELRRIPILRGWVNKGKRKGRGYDSPTLRAMSRSNGD
jgi:hypothetical protein